MAKAVAAKTRGESARGERAVSAADWREHLLRVADYLSHAQQNVPVGEARAQMRQTLEMAGKGSVVLTTHGAPEAAIVSMETLNAMRSAVMGLLVAQMDASLARTQERARAEREEPLATDHDELEALVGDARRRARHRPGTSAARAGRRR